MDAKLAFRRAALARGIDPERGATSYQAALVRAELEARRRRVDAARGRPLLEAQFLDDETRALLHYGIPAFAAAARFVDSMASSERIWRPTENAALLRIAFQICSLTRFLVRLSEAVQADRDRQLEPLRFRYRTLDEARAAARGQIILRA